MSMKKIASALLAGLLVLAAASAEPKVSKPRSSEVVIVFRVEVKPDVDRDFYSNYASFSSPWVSAALPRGLKKGELPADSLSFVWFEDGAYLGTRVYLGPAAGLQMVKISIPKNRTIDLASLRYFLYDNSYLYFDLPVLRKIVVPEGANYVYVGTFTYTIADEYFRISDITLSDEYDGAHAQVAKVYGESARLLRVNLIKLDPDQDKK